MQANDQTPKELLKGLGFRAKNVNMTEPPGGTFKAYHESDVIAVLEKMYTIGWVEGHSQGQKDPQK